MNDTHAIIKRSRKIQELNGLLKGRKAKTAQHEGTITAVHGLAVDKPIWCRIETSEKLGEVPAYVGGAGMSWIDVTWIDPDLTELTGLDYEGDMPFCIQCFSTGTTLEFEANGFDTYRKCAACGERIPDDIWDGFEDMYDDLQTEREESQDRWEQKNPR